MYLQSFFTWVSMGGYASYVWSAYGVTAILLLVHGLALRLHRKRSYRTLQRWLQSPSAPIGQAQKSHTPP